MNSSILSEEDAYRLIGESLSAGSEPAFRPDPDFYISIGRKWIEKNIESLKNIVCASKKANFIANSTAVDGLAIMVDIIQEHYINISPVPPGAVALLCFKMGIHKLCSETIADVDEEN